MKKKKAPILVLSIVGALLILIGLTNTGFWEVLAMKREEKKPETQTATTSVSDQDKSDMAKQIAATSKAPKRGMQDDEGGPSGIPDKPIILIEKQKYVPQQQNETAVSTRWYDSNANTSNKEAELNRKRGSN
jgi:hypothetical protein